LRLSRKKKKKDKKEGSGDEDDDGEKKKKKKDKKEKKKDSDDDWDDDWGEVDTSESAVAARAAALGGVDQDALAAKMEKAAAVSGAPQVNESNATNPPHPFLAALCLFFSWWCSSQNPLCYVCFTGRRRLERRRRRWACCCCGRRRRQ
jgi:hypothetical protein